MDYDVALNGIYIDGESQQTLPKKDSNVKFSSVVCSNGTASFDEEEWSLTLGELTDISSCKIYFTKESIINPATGTFLNIMIMIVLVSVSVYAIKRIIKRNKFYKV